MLFLLPAIGRTRDVEGEEINAETIAHLEKKGRPTRLLSLGGRPAEAFPRPAREYLKHGEKMGLPERPLMATRRPWYKMEVRPVPPLLFAYLGRRPARFIANRAGVRPLTGFLCIYPRHGDRDFTAKLLRALQHPETVAALHLVGKSYGEGAIKVEPRALERLPLTSGVVEKAGFPLLGQEKQRRFKLS